MMLLKNITSSLGPIIILLIISSVSPAKAQVPDSIDACMDDTILIPVNLKQLSDYENIYSYEFEYQADEGDLLFLGVDSGKTIIPPDGLEINTSASQQAPTLITITIVANNSSQPLYQEDAEDLLTLKFKAIAGQDITHTCSLVTRDGSGKTIEDQTLSNNIIVYDNILEIYDMPTLNLNALSFSATPGYESYKWSYRKKYSWNWPYGDLHYSGADAYFNGHGIYSVTATDEHGCLLSDERYFQIEPMPGIKLANGRQITAPDTFTVTLTGMCVYASCLSEDFTINSAGFDFEYEPKKLAFDTCLFDNTIFPEGYFKGYTVEETKIDENFSNLKINMIADESQPGFEHIEYAVGDFMKINFIPQTDGEAEIGMPYFEINGERAVTATIRQSVEILPAEDTGSYAKGTVWADGAPYNEGVVIAYSKTQEQFSQTAQTDINNGIFEFPATLIDGEYVFCAIPGEDSGYLPTYYGNRQTIDSAFVIHLDNYEGVVALNIDLIPDTAPEGTTKTATGKNPVTSDYDLYPNPVSTFLHLHIQGGDDNDQNYSLLITNIYGKEFYRRQNIKKSPGSNDIFLEIDVRDYPPGIYVIKTGNVSDLFIKQ